MHPAEEALLDFNPDENEIDGKLYDEIVELDTQPVRDSRQLSVEEVDKLIAKNDDESDDSSEDEGFEIGGKRGFNTNMDDYLNNFGSVIGGGKVSINQPKRNRPLSSQLNIDKPSFTKKLIESGDKRIR